MTEQPARDSRHLPLSLPGWMQRHLPSNVRATAAAIKDGSVRLTLHFPNETTVPLTMKLTGQQPPRPAFVIQFRSEGSAPENTRVLACHSLHASLRGNARRVVPWLRHVERLHCMSTRVDDVSIAPTAPRLRHIWTTLRICQLIENGKNTEARLALESLSAKVDDDWLLPVLSHLDFAVGVPLSAIARTAVSADDSPKAVGTLTRGFVAGLTGDRTDAVSAAVQLTEMALEDSKQPEFNVLRLAARLAELSNDAETALRCQEHVLQRLGHLADVLSALRHLQALEKWTELIDRIRGLLEQKKDSFPELLEFGRLCETAGDYELAAEVYRRCLEPGPAESNVQLRTEARISLARLALWKLELNEALSHLNGLETHSPPASALRLRAIAAFFEKGPGQTLAILDEAAKTSRDESRDGEHLLWRGEALLALGKVEEALKAASSSLAASHSLASRLLKERILTRQRLDAEPLIRKQRGWFSSTFKKLKPREIDVTLRELLDGQLPPKTLTKIDAHLPSRLRTLEKLTRKQGTNRGSHPTCLRRLPGGGVKLVKQENRQDSRQAAAALLARLRTESPAMVLERFEQLREQFPTSPYPYTYRGELRLWLGDAQGAYQDFESALNLEPARWAFIGMAASLSREDPTEANRLFDEGIALFGNLDSATTHVYRGEMRREQGDLSGALADLELAVAQRPSRVAARLNLALTYAALNREADAEHEIRRAFTGVPGFLFLAAQSLGRPAPTSFDIGSTQLFIERALELMRGNRSSWLYSMVDDAGTFRVLPASLDYVQLARHSLWLTHAAVMKKLDEELLADLALDDSAQQA